MRVQPVLRRERRDGEPPALLGVHVFDHAGDGVSRRMSCTRGRANCARERVEERKRAFEVGQALNSSDLFDRA